MEMMPPNPLSKHFRKPAIYLRLPSGGQYWPDGSIDLPSSGEIPVFPMTASDEITLKTPDALMNGQGVVDVIKSCCPNILNPWQCPSIDVDTILISIRIATYGNTMEFDSTCPKCSERHSYELPLGEILTSVIKPDYSIPVNSDGLTIKLKPQPYFSVNQTNMISYEEERIIQTINDESMTDEQKKTVFEEHLKRLVDLNIQILTDSTESITTPEGVTVAEPALINDFYKNTSSQLLKTIQERLKVFSQEAALKPQKIACSNCQHEYEIPVTFDYSNFFA